MNYCFFGTCYEDDHLLIDCLKSIAKQTILPNEIILIDSSKKGSIFKTLNKLFKDSNTIIKYENINLPRIRALNLAISRANSDYLLRFDSRTRFAKNYAEEALKFLNKKNKTKVLVGAVGGLQASFPFNKTLQAKISSDLMNRAYIFGNPLYRRHDYNGAVNSIYLGCYPKEVLKKVSFREEVSLISEDSQICQDIISKGYKIYISQDLRLKYLCRENIYSIIKLLRTYGRCRARTIISTKTIHDNKKYFLVFFMVIILPIFIFIFFKENIFLFFILLILIPFTYNTFHELNNYGCKKILYLPMLGCALQLSWLIGFLETLFIYNFIKDLKSNYL